MEDISSSYLRRRRAQLLKQMPALETLLRGSLIERYKRCGKPGCKCAEGPGHGPKYYLSVSFPGRRPQMDYVPQADHADVTERLANYHRVREIIEEICEINRELLRRREVSAVTHPHHRSAIGRRTHRQHARGLAHRRARAGADRGGLR
jgi:hypothetical protein